MSKFLLNLNKKSVFLVLLVAFVILTLNITTLNFIGNSNASIMVSRVHNEKDCWAIFEAISLAAIAVSIAGVGCALKNMFDSFVKEIKNCDIENNLKILDEFVEYIGQKKIVKLRI